MRNASSGGIHHVLGAAIVALSAACGGPLEQQATTQQQALEQVDVLRGPPAEMLAKKAEPDRPALAPNVTLGAEPAPKTGAGSRSPVISPSFTWAVAIAVSDQYPWVTRSTTVTATTNADVGSTPYYIKIYNGTNVIASCDHGTSCSITVTESCDHGTSCSITVTESSYTWDSFAAMVQDFSGTTTVASTGLYAIHVNWHTA